MQNDGKLYKLDNLGEISYEPLSKDVRLFQYRGVVKKLASHDAVAEQSATTIMFSHLPESRVDEAIDILIQSHSRAVSFNTGSEDVKNFYRNIFMDGFSVIATDATNNELVGVVFIKLRLSKKVTADDGFYTRCLENCQDVWVKHHINSLIGLENTVHLSALFDTYCLQIMEMAVPLKYEQTNMLGLLIKAAVFLNSKITSKQLEMIQMQIQSKRENQERIVISLRPVIAHLAVNEDMKEFLTKFDFVPVISAVYEQVNLNVCLMVHTGYELL